MFLLGFVPLKRAICEGQDTSVKSSILKPSICKQDYVEVDTTSRTDGTENNITQPPTPDISTNMNELASVFVQVFDRIVSRSVRRSTKKRQSGEI